MSIDYFEFSSNHLLDDGVLPDQDELDFIIKHIGRKSKLAKRICTQICAYLTSSYEGVVASSAAYRYENVCDDENTEEDHCIFFILLKKNDTKINCQEYRTFERCNKISPQSEKMNRHISLFEKTHNLPSDQLKKLVSFVQQKSDNLCKHHSNLIMVSSSWCKVRGFESEKEQITSTPCIALYVHTKGFIPVDEDPFETTFGGYSVDVREGVFTPFCGANDHHKNLKMGCAITGGHANENGDYVGGTLGVFVKLDGNDDKFAITCAHTVLNHKELKYVMENTDVNYENTKPKVYHPVKDPLNSFGHIRFATHTQGTSGNSGMEIAVLQVNPERWPIDGTFPKASNHLDKGFDQSYPLRFKSGKCCDISDLRLSSVVLKYGWTTGLTEGKVRMYGSKVKPGLLEHIILGYPLLLRDQIEIESLSSESFAKPGDSGALVLTHTKEGLVAVGILEGIFNDVYIVTPMKAILEDLTSKIGVCRLLSFDEISCTSATDADQMEKNETIETPQRSDTPVTLTASPPSTSNELEQIHRKLSAHGMQLENMQESINRLQNTIERLISLSNHRIDN